MSADPISLARIHAIERASQGPKPLTRREIRANIDWLLDDRPDLSDRGIARLLGVANSTVSRRHEQRLARQDPHADEPSDGDRYVVKRVALEVAPRLFKAMEKVWEARGFGIGDAVFGDRTGERLAVALSDAFGEDALDRAVRYRGWIDQAIDRLTDQ